MSAHDSSSSATSPSVPAAASQVSLPATVVSVNRYARIGKPGKNAAAEDEKAEKVIIDLRQVAAMKLWDMSKKQIADYFGISTGRMNKVITENRAALQWNVPTSHILAGPANDDSEEDESKDDESHSDTEEPVAAASTEVVEEPKTEEEIPEIVEEIVVKKKSSKGSK